MRNIPLLLTATVDPQGMKGANFDPSDRAAMYVDALNFYVTAFASRPSEHGSIVFAENSGYPAEKILSQVRKMPNVTIEYLSLGTDGFDQTKGKGYNETIVLRMAAERSEEIAAAGCFFKITGRLKVLNILRMLDECRKRRDSAAGLSFLADCKDHRVYEWLRMPINGHAGECRYWFASREFFLTEMAPRYAEMNDYTDPPVLAEDLMLDVCRKTRGRKDCHDRFRTQARISGKGGNNLGSGSSFFYSTDNDSLPLRIKCGLRQLLRWLLPWWRA